MVRNIYVKKMNGKQELYSENKLKRSLNNAGANKEVINKIIARVNKILYNGIETKKLYRFVFRELKKQESILSSRYSLKSAILQLGREGFNFEKFVAKLFEHKGYKSFLNQIVKGRNISHEVDVSAKKGHEILMIECKYHNKPWLGTDINVALAVYARFLDISKTFTRSMLITNTKFSISVIRYARGVRLELMGWKYPQGNSLEENIEKFKVYPITVLDLPKNLIYKCLSKGIVTVGDLKDVDPNVVARRLRVNKTKAKVIVDQCCKLCET